MVHACASTAEYKDLIAKNEIVVGVSLFLENMVLIVSAAKLTFSFILKYLKLTFSQLGKSFSLNLILAVCSGDTTLHHLTLLPSLTFYLIIKIKNINQ